LSSDPDGSTNPAHRSTQSPRRVRAASLSWRNDIAAMVATPDVKQRLQDLGFAPVANTPEEFGARIKVEIARWGKVVEAAGIAGSE